MQASEKIGWETASGNPDSTKNIKFSTRYLLHSQVICTFVGIYAKLNIPLHS